MGKWADWFLGPLVIDPLPEEPTTKFAAVAPIGSDFQTWNALVGGRGLDSVSRAEAMSIPAVKRARDIFVALGSLPIKDYRDGVVQDRNIFSQPESTLGYTRSYTLGMTVDDLFFYSSSLWVVTLRDSTGYPTAVRRIEWSKWTQDDNGVIKVGPDTIRPEDAILFLSTEEGFLRAGASTVRSARILAQAADRYAAKPTLVDFFQVNDGSEPSAEDKRRFLLDWTASREAGVTGFIPEGIDRKEATQLTPEEIQLIGAREFCVAEVARITGISPTWLGIPVSTRTYTNAESENLDFLKTPARPYIAAIEERLSLGDVSPNGHYAKFSLDAYLRADTSTRYTAYAIALDKGFLTLDEVRSLEDRPALTQPGEGNDGSV